MNEGNWVGAYVGRRVASFSVGSAFFQRMLTTGWMVEAGFQCVEGVPPGARLVAIVPRLDQETVILLFEHADFAIVQEHATVYQPRLVTLKNLGAAPERA